MLDYTHLGKSAPLKRRKSGMKIGVLSASVLLIVVFFLGLVIGLKVNPKDKEFDMINRVDSEERADALIKHLCGHTEEYISEYIKSNGKDPNLDIECECNFVRQVLETDPETDEFWIGCGKFQVLEPYEAAQAGLDIKDAEVITKNAVDGEPITFLIYEDDGQPEQIFRQNDDLAPEGASHG